MLSVPVSIREFPAYALRLLATARAALLAAGVADPAQHVLVYRSAWNVRILLSRAPFDAARIAAAKAFCDARSFDISYFPGIDSTAAQANIYNDLPPVSFESGEVESGGPARDAIAEEAGAVLAGRPTHRPRASTSPRSRSTGPPATRCCGSTGWARCCGGSSCCRSRRSARWSIWRCWRRRR